MNGRIRCAIYTRKSSEEGLEQSFNSLHAQREACEAYILSQRHEGWQVLGTEYDDGGFSGGSMDRPALKRLIDDIAAGKVNTVVVYKVDRLTRSLADFAKIIEQFDAKHVSFVSVTQQFNTTTSMGRLTLNVLLSFAQFEREVTGERIRDKIAASKQKGMWMGGRVPFGYDLRERKLYINPEEAKSVREIFQQYLRLRSVSALKEHLDQGPIRSKVRTPESQITGGEHFSRGALHHLLTNHIYIGEISHKGAVYLGAHEALIERDQWQKVQRMLTENQQGSRRNARATRSSLLTGIIFDGNNNRYTPTHAIKGGRHYRYYTSQAVIRKASKDDFVGRIPAYDLERAVTDRILAWLGSPGEILQTTRELGIEQANFRRLLSGAKKKVTDWSVVPAQDQKAFLKLVLRHVVVRQDAIEINLKVKPLIESIDNNQTSAPVSMPEAKNLEQPQIITLSCPFERARKGAALRLVLGGNQPAPEKNYLAIIKAIARARLWYEQLVSGDAASLRSLARMHGVTPRYVNRIFACASLGPDAVECLTNQRYCPHLTLDRIIDRVPLEWGKQRGILVNEIPYAK